MKRLILALAFLTVALWGYCDQASFVAPAICPEPQLAEISATVYHPFSSIQIKCPDKVAAEWVKKHLDEWYGELAPKVVASTRKVNGINEEGYEISIGQDGVDVIASTLKGVRYALYSIRQIAIPARGTAKVEGWIVPEAKIKDEPALGFRGIHICWFHETESWEIERMIRLAAYYKMNYAVIETWGTFRSDVAPWYGWPDGAMTKDELARLRTIAEDLGITLIPEFNVFGHASHSRGGTGKHSSLDFNPEYQPYFEPDAGWNWCLSNPETRKLLTAIIHEMMDAFGNPPFFHIGCDEAQPPTCPDCIGQSYSELLVNHIKAMNEAVSSRGARTMLWHDMLLKKGDPRWKGFYANGTAETAEALMGFPRDIVICDWFYGEEKDAYPTLEYFKGLGFMTLTCPWENRNGTHKQALQAREGKADGILGTLWHHYFGGNMVNIFQTLSCAAWNEGAQIRTNGNKFRTHLRQIGWDMKVSDPRHTGIFYYEIPLEPTLNN